jgi:hypothetical protein
MNGELFAYGILTEASDIRAHVSVVNRTIYVFQTRFGVAAIEAYAPPLREARQPGVTGVTARGWLVNIDWIADLRRVRFWSWSGWDAFADERLSTSQKGALAVQCVLRVMQLGRFPFWLDAMEDTRDYIQIAGTDVLVFCKKRVQVKCDARSGDRPRGTGHLFLQQAERNPLKRR